MLQGGILRFNILGPFEAWSDGARLDLGGPIQKRVLAALLLDVGHMLPISRLVEATWDEEPPATATHQVRKAVADLRRRIPGGAQCLVTDGPGYAVVLSDTQLDLNEFDSRVRQAKAVALQGDQRQAVTVLRSALQLWRGPVLAGMGGPIIDAAAVALEERELITAERYFELRLVFDDPSELVEELRSYILRHPLRETLRGQLMLTLYRSGRRAEALDEYHKAREHLVEELGIEPGPQLGKLYEQILRTSPGLAAPTPPEPPRTAPQAAPQTADQTATAQRPKPVTAKAEAPSTLPHDPTGFVGRHHELRQLLSREHGAEQETRIVAIDGMGGVGKTSLAVKIAHQLAAEYPDGQLYIDLRGYSPEESPVSEGPALEVLLRALGLPHDRIPDDDAGRTAQWRRALVGKQLLLLLDNASEASVIRRLLPASPGCLVLVTSRARLVDLDGAEWVSIDVMAPEDSEFLVAELFRAQQIETEPEAAAELAELCGHLPLAIRIATARMCNRPLWSPQYLIERLRDETRKLDVLTSGDRSVAATLRLSYQVLPESCRAAFRRLALHPSAALDIYSAAALLSLDFREAEEHLEMLLDARLLQQPGLGLYVFHDLVRSFAISLGGPASRLDQAATTRMLDYYLAATESASEILFPGRTRRSSGTQQPTAQVPPIRQADEARRWFAREYSTLMSVVNSAVGDGYHRHAVYMAREIGFHLNALGKLREFAELSRLGLAAARRVGDAGLLSVSLSNLGVACWKLGLYAEGAGLAAEARDLAAQTGDRHTQAHSEGTLGLYKSLQGDFPGALRHLEAAVALEHELQASRAEAESRTVLSTLYEQWGRYPEAAAEAQKSIALMRELGRHETALAAFNDLALAHFGMRDYAAAEEDLTESLRLCDEESEKQEPGHVAMALALSANLAQHKGDFAQATYYANQALALVETSASPPRQAKVYNLLGRLMLHQKESSAALRVHGRAHAIASAIDFRVEEAYALSGMARAAAALDDVQTAADHRTASEELFTALGIPESGRRA